jgi:8-oxo-dGTP pyrophosphatase MutT (NUDIX family)
MKQDKKNAVKEKAGIVAYKYTDAYKKGREPLVLLVTARKTKGAWVFPVGGVDKGESLKTAAKRECEEESGYRVKAGKKLSPVEACMNGKTIRFTFYLATVVDETDTWETDRTRAWVPVSEAMDKVPALFQGVAREAAQRLTEKKEK